MTEHHALLMLGTWEDVLPFVPEVFLESSVDRVFVRTARFSIEEARLLKEQAHTRPLEKEIRVFVIAANSIHLEAQNALLKLFEDPPATARFLLVLKRKEELIPTLYSRLQELKTENKKTEQGTTFLNFLASTYYERLELIKEHTKEKDTPWIEAILDGAEAFTTSTPHRSKELLDDVIRIRKYASARGASLKILLEHLALSLPIEAGSR